MSRGAVSEGQLGWGRVEQPWWGGTSGVGEAGEARRVSSASMRARSRAGVGVRAYNVFAMRAMSMLTIMMTEQKTKA